MQEYFELLSKKYDAPLKHVKPNEPSIKYIQQLENLIKIICDASQQDFQQSQHATNKIKNELQKLKQLLYDSRVVQESLQSLYISIRVLFESIRWQSNNAAIRTLIDILDIQFPSINQEELIKLFKSNILRYLQYPEESIHRSVLILFKKLIDTFEQDDIKQLLTDIVQDITHNREQIKQLGFIETFMQDRQSIKYILQKAKQPSQLIMLDQAKLKDFNFEYIFKFKGDIKQYLEMIEIILTKVADIDEFFEVLSQLCLCEQQSKRKQSIEFLIKHQLRLKTKHIFQIIKACLFDSDIVFRNLGFQLAKSMKQHINQDDFYAQIIPFLFLNSKQREQEIKLIIGQETYPKYIQDDNFLLLANICLLQVNYPSGDLKTESVYILARIIGGNKSNVHLLQIIDTILDCLLPHIGLENDAINITHYIWIATKAIVETSKHITRGKQILEALLKSFKLEYLQVAVAALESLLDKFRSEIYAAIIEFEQSYDLIVFWVKAKSDKPKEKERLPEILALLINNNLFSDSILTLQQNEVKIYNIQFYFKQLELLFDNNKWLNIESEHQQQFISKVEEKSKRPLFPQK